MYIRWMGAFRKNGSLSEAVLFELSRTTDVACEQLVKGKSLVEQARVGLLVNPSAVYKRYNGDVWSEYTVDGKLHTTRKGYEATSAHKEAFAKPIYTGLVIKNGSLATLSYAARQEIAEISKRHSLPVFRLVKGKLVAENV